MKRRNFLTSLLSLPFGIGAAAILMKPLASSSEITVVSSKYIEPIDNEWKKIHPGRIVWNPHLKMNILERSVKWPT